VFKAFGMPFVNKCALNVDEIAAYFLNLNIRAPVGIENNVRLLAQSNEDEPFK